MERLTKVFAETTHGTKGYETINKIKVDTESISNLSEIITTLGMLEDVLEEFELTSAEDLRNHLNFQDNMAIWEGELNYKNKIADLEHELSELKQKAIVPKFQIGQEVYIINKEYFYKKHWCVEKHKIVGIEDKIDRKEKYVRWYTLTYGDTKIGNRYKFQEKDIFTTKEEAEQKLAQLKGEE